MPETKPRVRIRNGREHKKRKTYLLPLDSGDAFRLRRVDIMGLLMEGALPTPLLSAVGRFQNLRGAVMDRNQDIGAIFEQLSPEDRAAFMELLRRVAVLTAVEPKMTHSKRASLADDDLLWVGGVSDVPGDEQHDEAGDVTTTDLMLIWRATLGEAGVVTLSDDDALEFRQGESPSNDPPVPDGSGVRTETVVMVPDAGDSEGTRVGGARIIHH